MDSQGVWPQSFSFFSQKPVVVQVGSSYLTSDAGLLPIRQLDEHLGLTEQFAAALLDPRPGRTEHSFLEMTRARVYGILAGYEDQNDHDSLRRDALFKLLAGRSPEDDDLASQPTLSRFENAIGPKSLKALQEVLIDQFIASFEEPPARLTFDIDTFDDPAHGQQQLVMFHGYYQQYQYLPRVITCAENDQVVMVALLFGAASPAVGAADDLRHLAVRLRAEWPDVRIIVRADAGFATPAFYDPCEELRVDYTIGLKTNPVLTRRSDGLLADALSRFNATGQPQRLFDRFAYQADSWPAPRQVLVKAEANAQGTNRRYVVTNRPGASVLPEATYDAYADRGESENRNKELKRGFCADRLSDHRFMANYFRLYLHVLAANLLVRIRRLIADPPAEQPTDAPAADPLSPSAANPPQAAAAEPSDALPIEALAGDRRKRWFNRRREQDPLGEGHAQTWRLRLIKVAAEIVVSSRRILIRLCGTWPFLRHYQAVASAVNAACAPRVADSS
jgi:hypothetical protein